MLQLHYFASLRERLGVQQEAFELPVAGMSVGQFIEHLLSQRGPTWEPLQDAQRVLVAVDKTIVERSHVLHGNEEIAFFPPMTGG